MQHYKVFILLFSTTILFACNRYMDTVKGNNVRQDQGNFTFYPDSNLFFFKGGLPLKADNETYYPKTFRLKLPKKIKSYNISNSEQFGFYYDDKQVILIKINLRNSNLKDTIYSPTENTLTNFIERELYSTNGKYDIKKIEFDKTRKQSLLQKGDATIILYNILPENHDHFIQDVKTFEFTSQ